jgi:hypothetical protein
MTLQGEKRQSLGQGSMRASGAGQVPFSSFTVRLVVGLAFLFVCLFLVYSAMNFNNA